MHDYSRWATISNSTIDRNSIPHLESPNTLASDVSRRSFLSTASTAVAAAGDVQFSAKSYARILGANDCIGVSVIGGGVNGMTHFGVMNKLKQSNNLVPIAVADCWKTRADAGKESIVALESHADYRRVLDSKYGDCVFCCNTRTLAWLES